MKLKFLLLLFLCISLEVSSQNLIDKSIKLYEDLTTSVDTLTSDVKSLNQSIICTSDSIKTITKRVYNSYQEDKKLIKDIWGTIKVFIKKE